MASSSLIILVGVAQTPAEWLLKKSIRLLDQTTSLANAGIQLPMTSTRFIPQVVDRSIDSDQSEGDPVTCTSELRSLGPFLRGSEQVH